MVVADPVPAWRLVEVNGSAGEIHELDLAALARGDRLVAVCVPEDRALVIGSTQHESDVDADGARAAGVDIVRRRSGGGAVWLHPHDSLWIDLWVPRGDDLWTDDVSKSMLFAGQAFARALEDKVSASVWRDRFEAGRFGRTVCFGSMAPGEVHIGSDKLVGISQRRDRHGARLQCVLYRRWNPGEWASFIADDAARLGVASMPVATVDVSANEMAARVVSALALA